MPTPSTTAPLQTSKILVGTHINHHIPHPKSFISNPLKTSISIKKPSTWLVPHGTKSSSGSGGLDFRKIEKALRLSLAIQNRDIKELLTLAAEECREYFSILPTIDTAELSKVRVNLADCQYKFDTRFVLNSH